MFLQAAKRTPVNLEEWAVQMMERHNRKSHLAPQLSPSTQALLRGETTASPSRESSASTASKTPTTGDTSVAEEDGKAAQIPDSSRIYSPAVSGGMYPNQAFPPRKSSTFSQATTRVPSVDGAPSYVGSDHRDSASGDYRDSANFTTLPIRPAPTGPLPAPPGPNFRTSPAKRSGPNGAPSAYPGDNSYQ